MPTGPPSAARVNVALRFQVKPAPAAPSLVALAFFLALFVLALRGALGGGPPSLFSNPAPSAALDVAVPDVLRTGEFFEMIISVDPTVSIARPTVGIELGLWRGATINSFYPAAAAESFRDGAFRFEFDRLEQGRILVIKVDGQLNEDLIAPLAGKIIVSDGDRPLASTDIRIKVFP